MKVKSEHFENPSVKYMDLLIRKFKVRLNDTPGMFAKVAAAIGRSGALLGDIETKSVDSHCIVRDITVFAESEEIIEKTVKLLNKISEIKILKVTDEVFSIHEGGKIEIQPTVDLNNLADLRKAYTPGVASVCRYIYNHPEKYYDYTYVGNTVAIVTNGTAILGLGNIGVRAGMPVMEGKSVIFKKFSGINAIPILVESEDPEVVINTVKAISPSFGAIQLEDIKSPECFEIERRLSEMLDIPVFHDDQHGTAVVVLAATINALKKTGKDKKKIKVVMNGAGAAGIAICRLLMNFGIKNILLCDQGGAIYEGRKENMNPEKQLIAKETNRKLEKGSLAHVMKGKDMFIGVSGPDLVTPAMIKTMAKRSICFALANPVPEIYPKEAIKAGAAYALDGKSLNNALAFPGIFKGALKSRAKRITIGMQVAAARAIASCVDENELVPNQLDPKVHSAVAKAVHDAANK